MTHVDTHQDRCANIAVFNDDTLAQWSLGSVFTISHEGSDSL